MTTELRAMLDDFDRYLEVLKSPTADDDSKNTAKWEISAMAIELERVASSMVKHFCKSFKLTKKAIKEYMAEDDDDPEETQDNIENKAKSVMIDETKNITDNVPAKVNDLEESKGESESEESDEEEEKPKKKPVKKATKGKGSKAKKVR